MAQIRQEISIWNESSNVTQVAAGTATEIPRAAWYWDPSQYNGTVQVYIEVVARFVSGTAGVRVGMYNTTDNAVIGTAADAALVATSHSSMTLTRAGDAFSDMPTSPKEMTVYTNMAAQAGDSVITVKAIRIIIIQNATTLTNTETQIEIGNKNLARTTETAAILTNPKYWKYDASKWDGTKTFYAEAVYDSGDMDTISVYLYESAAIDAPSWSAKATIVSAATTTTPTRTRVSFTPTDGRWYTIFSLNGSMDNHDIYRAGIIVDQTDTSVYSESNQDNTTEIKTTGPGSAIGKAQSFTATGGTLTSAKFYLKKSGSPTGNATAKLYAHSGTLGTSSIPTGAALATSDTFDVSTLTTSYALITFTFSGGNQYSMVAGTNYVISIEWAGTGSQSDIVQVGVDSSSPTAVGNQSSQSEAGTWTASSTVDVIFYVIGNVGITKLEPQYLLANTLFAAGTGLQTFLTDWDSTEWDDGAGSITYYFQAEAANGSTSDVTLEQADGGGTVTNSTLTNIDNAQISAALTMPGDENLDVTATTNAGDVAAARISVAYVYSASPPVPDKVPYTNPNLKALLIMGVGV